MPSEPLFRVVDVSGWENVEEEPSGAATKLWLGQPDTEPEVRWLFKTVTIKGGHVHGEDWAEKTASHLGALLGLPCAQVELAAWHGYDGCISRNLRPHSTDMQPGRVLLENSAAPGYVHRSRGKEHPGHSLENIRMALEGAAPPPGCVLPFEASAFDVFAGYVVFDAWVANQDRHDHNWSVLIPGTQSSDPMRLSGSYDHGSSLGFSLRGATCARMLTAPDGVETWCRRGRAIRIDGQPGLVVAAQRALDLATPPARAYWIAQLGHVESDQVRSVIDRMPRMSEDQRAFVTRLLEISRGRLLHACAQCPCGDGRHGCKAQRSTRQARCCLAAPLQALLFPLFAQRAMDPRRPDYGRYISRLGLDGEPGPWDQIARSQGHREGDTIQLFPEPTVDGDGVRCLFLVHGIRHIHKSPRILEGTTVTATRDQIQEALSKLRPGDELGIYREPGNEVNPLAIAVTDSPDRPVIPLGWVPDLLVEDLRRIRESAQVQVTVEHVNGADAPWHLRLLARLRASPVPAGFRFFVSDRWAPLAGGPAAS